MQSQVVELEKVRSCGGFMVREIAEHELNELLKLLLSNGWILEVKGIEN